MTSIYDIIDSLDKFNWEEKAHLFLMLEDKLGREFYKEFQAGNIKETSKKFDSLDDQPDFIFDAKWEGFHYILDEEYGMEMDDNSVYDIKELCEVAREIRVERHQRPLWGNLLEFECFIDNQIDMAKEEAAA